MMRDKIYTTDWHRFWSAVFLIAGMSIGASELGLPVVLRFSGYLPAVVAMFVVYICMLASGILLSRLFMAERERDLPALFHKYLGKGGALLFNISYFALAFCLLVAYWSGLHGILHNFNVGLPVTIMIGVLIYYGLRNNLKFLCGANSALTIGLILSFIFIVVASLRGESLSLFSSACWSQLPKSLPIILCSYGYHQVIPMICEQLDYDARSVNRALLCGTLFPLVFNIVILTVAFRLFSVDELSEAAKLELPVFVLLKQHFNSNFFTYAGRCFSLFAISTSLLAVSMAMRGALRDVFRGKKVLQNSTEMLIIVPMFVAILKPELFFTLLGLCGGIFGNLMAGILPVTPFLGGKFFKLRYLLLWLVFVAIFIIECINLM
ncbi:MAG: hypothetical protein LBS87_01945 [Puniceicoccales bacterium]|jgi:tyrosine-specific transport protein|nr:hypothetical protein [Puniceicoccales bacterium]